MKALQFRRSEVRYAAANLASRLRPGAGATRGPLRLVDPLDPPELPAPDWIRLSPRLSGICGSDLSTVEGHASPYFEDLVSFPFIPGHEVLAVDEHDRRVVVEPVLGHEARGFAPPFDGAAPGDGDDYRHLVAGDLEPGLQTGYCTDAGGGWATEMVAHPSQLHVVPDALSDDAAVLLEPAAGGVHAALKARADADTTVAIIGAGTMGLVTAAALTHFTPPGRMIVAAKYPRQRELARALGADEVVQPEELARAVRRATGSFMIGPRLSGGADVVIDAVGTAASLTQAIGICRPRGRVVLLGMPGTVRVDLTPLWHRETELVGAYTYGTETLPDGRSASSFSLAMELAAALPLADLVSARYPLDRYEDAIRHAAEAGPRGGVKIVFEPTA
ncbi:MAG: zinc-binding dehydrogenase [Acidimicrobiales bacterium]